MHSPTPLHDRLIATFGSAIALCLCLIALLVVNLVAPTAETMKATFSGQVDTSSL